MYHQSPEEKEGILKEIRSVVELKNLEHKEDGDHNNIILKNCPFCGDDRFKFEIGISYTNLGLWNCFVCSGDAVAPAPKAWSVLKKHLLGEEHFIIQSAVPMRRKAAFNDQIDRIKAWHRALKCDVEVMTWLHEERMIPPTAMEKYHLGVSTQPYEGNKVKTLVIPYFYKHDLVNVKFRVLPPAPKGFFRLPKGESILFNYDNIDITKKYIFVCEGELDAISLANAGEENVVSITVGAKSFRPEWYDLLKGFEIIYLVLDNDIPGQEGAKILADRLGPEKCYNILLPPEKIAKTSNGVWTILDTISPENRETVGIDTDTITTLKDLNDYFKVHTINNFKGQALKATKFELDTIYSIESVLDNLEHKIKSEGSILAGLETPWPSLNNKMGPMAKGDLIYLSGKPKTGKCLSKDSILSTSVGLLSIKELFKYCTIDLDDNERVDNITNKNIFVETSDGRKKITHLTTNGKRALLEVKTKLGLSIKVTKNHPLKIMNYLGQLEWKTAEELKIGDYLAVSRVISKGSNTNYISNEAARFIGYLIADGSLNYRNRIAFSNSNVDVVKDFKNCCNKILPKINIKKYKKLNSNTVDYHINSQKLRRWVEHEFGLDYVKAAGKTLPLIVRSSSNKVWKEFLAAYFECESYINTQRNNIEVTSASKKLIDDVQLLLLSLGIVSRQRIKTVKNYNQLYYKLLLPSDEAVKFILTIGYISKEQKVKAVILLQNNKNKRNKSNDLVPYQQNWIRELRNEFPTNSKLKTITNNLISGTRHTSHALLERIVSYIETKDRNTSICNYWNSLQKIYFDKIVSIKNIGEDDTYDIVQPETHEFIGNGIINHNTTLALNICYNLSYLQNIPTLLFCLEMAPERLGQKLVSLHRKIDVTNQEIQIEDIQLARTSLTRDGIPIPLYFGYSADKGILYDPDALMKIFKIAKRKYGLALIVFDNIQYLCRSTTNVPQVVAKLSRDFKLMAMEFRIPVIVVAQPVKLGNEQIMTASHLRDSGSLEADADTVIILNRNRYVEDALKTDDLESDKIESGITRVAVDRTRYSRGGFTSLFLDGGRSFFTEAKESDMTGVGTR